jgi:hypothetical protein
VDLDARDLIRGDAGAEAAQPVERRPGPLLGAEHGAVPSKEAHLDAGPVGDRDARARADAGGVLDAPDVERLADAFERRDGVRREDRGAAAAEGARERGVGAEHGDAPEL